MTTPTLPPLFFPLFRTENAYVFVVRDTVSVIGFCFCSRNWKWNENNGKYISNFDILRFEWNTMGICISWNKRWKIYHWMIENNIRIHYFIRCSIRPTWNRWHQQNFIVFVFFYFFFFFLMIILFNLSNTLCNLSAVVPPLAVLEKNNADDLNSLRFQNSEYQ